MNASTVDADVVLPAAVMSEKTGSTTNLEGRVAPVAKKVNTPGVARADWMIAVELADRLGHDLGVSSVEGISEQLTSVGAWVQSERSVRNLSTRRQCGTEGWLRRRPHRFSVMYDGGVASVVAFACWPCERPSRSSEPSGARTTRYRLWDMVRLVSEHGSAELPAVPMTASIVTRRG